MYSRILFRTLAVFLLCGICAYAQLNGRLTGTVVDQTGAPVPGATVNVFLPNGTTAVLTTTTSSDGIFAFSAVRPDTYDIAVEAAGFTKVINRAVKVDPARDTALPPVTLEVQSTQQTVEVSATSQTVQTTTSDVSTTVTQRQIQSLPVLDRQVSTLFLTQAGVSSGRGATVINGMRTSFANVTLDGINIQDNFIRTNALDYIPNKTTIEQVAEMTISTSNSMSSVGIGGAQMVLATPSGSNQFHGSVYWYNRNSALASNDWFNNKNGVKKPFLNQNQAGFSVGGPIIHDKLFFYGNYEAYRNRQQTGVLNTILTPDARNGIFTYKDTTSGVIRKINLLAARNGVANQTPSNQAIGAILAQVPAAGNSTDAGDGLNTTGYYFNASANEDRNVYLGKIDYYLSARHMFSGTYEYNTDIVDRPDVGSFYTQKPPVSNNNKANFFSTAWRWTLSPTLTNEVRGGANLAPGKFVDNQKYPAYFITGQQFTNPLNGGSLGLLSQGRDTNTYAIQDNASWVKGKHSIYFGFQSQFIRTAPYNDAGIIPTYTVGLPNTDPGFTTNDIPNSRTADINTANLLYATIAGLVSGYSQTFNVTSTNSGFVSGATNLRHFSYDTYSGYFQDNYRVMPRLTLNLGLRYDYYTRLNERDSLFLMPRLENGNYIQTLLDPNAVLDFAGNSVGRPYYKKDLNNFAPSIGFAWDIFGDGKTSLRGGYGIYYVNDDTITGIRNNITTSSGLTSLVTSTTASGVLGTNNPAIPTPTFKVPRTLADNYALDPTSAAGMPDPNLVTPYVQQWHIGIQREIKGTVFEVRYVGNHATKLLRAFDYNQVIVTPDFLADFKRARSNGFLAQAAGKGFDPRYNAAIAGSQQLTLLPTLPNGGYLTNSVITSPLKSGEVGQLAYLYQVNGINGNLNFFQNPNILGGNAITNFSNSNYNSLQVDVRRRSTSWFLWQANYTYSKALSDEAGNDQNRFEPFIDLKNPSIERAPAPFDLRHSLKGNYLLDLPFGKGRHYSIGNRFVDGVFGGWSTSGILTIQSGTPFSILSGRGTINRSSRSTLNTATTLLKGDDLDKIVGFFMTGNGPTFINPSAIGPDGRGVASDGSAPFAGQVFFNPDPGTLGTLQRRSFYGPHFVNFDASILKTFKITERQSLQFRADAFNLANHPNFYVGNETSSTTRFNINQPTFGKITTTLDQIGRGTSGRVMQFGLYYRF